MLKSDQPINRAITKAIEWLARREHSQLELRNKLRARGFSKEEIEPALTHLIAKGFQSDDRFLESFVAGRTARGHGPIAIEAELRLRGISGEAVYTILSAPKCAWIDLARFVRIKRFGADLPKDTREQMAQMRFLAQRGFTHEQIRLALQTADPFSETSLLDNP